MTTEKPQESELEKIHKRTRYTAIAAGCIMLIGVMIVALIGIFAIGMSFTIEKSHLQNPSMPLDQYPENATYVWTQKEVISLIQDLIPVGIAGVIAIGGGFAVLVLLPDRKFFHKAGCNQTINTLKNVGKHQDPIDGFLSTWKYCPECGIKLSELEPKTKR